MPFSIHEPLDMRTEDEHQKVIAGREAFRRCWLEEIEASRRFRAWIWVGIVLLLAGLAILFFPTQAYAHEHQPGESSEQQRVVEWLQKWRRPQGVFNRAHRQESCCWVNGGHQDCFPVKEMRRTNGVLEVLPDAPATQYDRWYKANTKVDEDLQPDPRESPDGRSYVCIGGEQIQCLVKGSGM